MGEPVTINLRHVARGLDIPLPKVQAVVELLDEGNTVPFVTRYRKDQTGGLDEEQIRQIQSRLVKTRMLADRKQTILRSIESQGKLTEKLAKQIRAAGTTKRLEDLYLPYKPKKQTLATLARSRGLEPLAEEILVADAACADLDRRAADFVNLDRQVPTAADALLGAGHILAEQVSEMADLRQRLRETLQRTGKLVSTRVGGEPKPEEKPPAAEHPQDSAEPPAAPSEPPQAIEEPPAAPSEPPQAIEEPPAPSSEPPQAGEEPPALPPAPPDAAAGAEVQQPAETGGEASAADADSPAAPSPPPPSPPPPKPARAERKPTKKELKKKKAEEARQKAFSDYFDYREEVKKIPPHRVLAINRGERAKVLRVKVEYDWEAIEGTVEETFVSAAHPHAEFLRGCARDSLARLILPSLEREIRRELTERAETHAVGVFAKNLRNLLLQPPVHNRRVLAVDPGFKSGCKLVALDDFGNVLAHAVIYLVGKPDRRPEARDTVCDLVERFQLTLVAIGNGTACRETEDFFAELISERFEGKGVAFVIVNEAGASVYSTSRLGREEFPHYDATLRGAISIGRRLQDPLSELVKIDPANIGVGLYQHDVKAKHLRASLDEVVESCVNYVGVDLNTASPALLRYVSGLNQLTARRLYEYRIEHGPFRNREQLRDVPGFGEATFVQSAGFLKIPAGDCPFDATWIHPESYQIAAQVLEKLGSTPESLAEKEAMDGLSEKLAAVDVPGLAVEFEVGALLLGDIFAQLARPGRDPREDLPGPVFKQGVLKLEDLEAGMELTGTVLNVVDFGAFVDIGMHDCGLVHVSQMADKFIRDPHDVVAVGDIVRVWVLQVDRQRRRVSLSMIPPGTRRQVRPSEPRPPRRGAGERPPQEPRPERARKTRPKGGQPPRHRQQRPPKTAHRPKSRPKPVTPITEDMKKGKEPMRSFSDLAQFFQGDDASKTKNETWQESKKTKKKRPRKPAADSGEAKDAGADGEPPATNEPPGDAEPDSRAADQPQGDLPAGDAPPPDPDARGQAPPDEPEPPEEDRLE